MVEQSALKTPADVGRVLQLALASIWFLDGLLQAQQYMYAGGFAHDVLAGSAQGNPDVVAEPVSWVANLVHASPGPWNGAFVLAQLGIGALIAIRPTAQIGLAGSALWGLAVWIFGEGLGGLLTGGASIWTGAPGAAALYVVAAILLWPGAAKPRRVRFAVASWVFLWGLFAVLNLLPQNRSAGWFHDLVSSMATGNPSWLNNTLAVAARGAAGHGLLIALTTTLACAIVALSGLLPTRLLPIAAVLASALAMVTWVLGQACGALFGGQSTDPNAGPMLILIAVAYLWTRRAAAGARDASEPRVTLEQEASA